MKKVVVALFVILALSNQAFGQKMSGPKVAKAGTLVKITFDAGDFKLKCQPENTDWEVAQTLSSSNTEGYGDVGKKTIYFVPQKDATYTFALATDKPLALEMHTVVVGSGVNPSPPVPIPPTPDAVKDELSSAYLVSPDATAAKKLGDAYQTWAKRLDGGQYKIDSNEAKADLKKLVTDSGTLTTELRPFKDKVAELLNKSEVILRRGVLTKAIEVLAATQSNQNTPGAKGNE